MLEVDHDQEIERRAHPENFAPVDDEEEEIKNIVIDAECLHCRHLAIGITVKHYYNRFGKFDFFEWICPNCKLQNQYFNTK